ncbi:Ltp family lipoprotein [Terrisporobacter sp.]
MAKKMTQCKTCSKEIAVNAKVCPNCGAKNKKVFYKRPWLIILVLLIIIGAIGAGGEEEVSETADNTTKQESTQTTDDTEEVTNDTEEAQDEVPTEYKSALIKAQNYNDTMYMSKKGLYEQLVSEYGEKFSPEAAQYAIDNVDADWKENALEKAKEYQEQMSMSPSAIYDQLVSNYGEKFTPKQAEYAINHLD